MSNAITRQARLLLLMVATLFFTLPSPRVEAEVASALLHYADALPEQPNRVVVELRETAVNRNGGFAVRIKTSANHVLSHVWGNPTGGPGSILRTQGLVGSLIQSSFNGGLGLDDAGRLAYAARCRSIATDIVSDTIWLDDTMIVAGGEPYPHEPGTWWAGGWLPQITAEGQPFFLGGISDEPGGAIVKRGLFSGAGANPVLLTGDLLPGLPTPLASVYDYDCSLLGSRHIAQVFLEAPTETDAAIVIDGAGLEVGGSLVREGTSVPLEAGGLPGEHWKTFHEIGIAENGDWFLEGVTDADPATDDFLMRNGTITHREGDTLDGEILQGGANLAAMNENGDLAFFWVTTQPTLFLNDRAVLRAGEPVDWDGDGVADPDWKLVSIGYAPLTLSERDASGQVRLYFTGSGYFMDTGPAREAVFRVIAEPEPVTAAPAASRRHVADLLGDASPNPFVRRTKIAFGLRDDSPAELTILDVAGRRVATLVDDHLSAGDHSVTWDGRTDAGTPVAAGVYFYRLDTGDFSATRKVIQLRPR